MKHILKDDQIVYFLNIVHQMNYQYKIYFYYQNEIVKNLKGIYKNRYLYFTYNGKNKKIRLYAKDKNILPKDNQNIIVNSGHISIYKSKVQITLHKKSDYIVIKK
jgi:hypothetical protein